MDEMKQPPVPPAGYLQPAFWAGFCSGVLSGVPVLNSACCLWMGGGGVLAVYFFKLQYGFPIKRPGDGGRLGLLAGMFGCLVAIPLNLVSQILVFRGWGNFTSELRKHLEESLSRDPQAKEAMSWALTTDGLITLTVFCGLAFLLAYM